jgi:hypothetical protein
LNDKLPHDVNDTLDAAINEGDINWDTLSDLGSLDNEYNKLPHNGNNIDSYHLPDLSSSYNDGSNNLHDKIPHNIKDTLDAVIYGKTFHPK